MVSNRERKEQPDPTWLPPGVMARDEAADLEEPELGDEPADDDEDDLFLRRKCTTGFRT